MLTFEVSPSSNADLTNESHGNGFLQASSVASDWIRQIDVLRCVTPKCLAKAKGSNEQVIAIETNH